MLSSGTIIHHAKDQPIKQGWVLKKSGSGFFSLWRQKYLVLRLESSRSGRIDPNAGYLLQIYDDRDHSKPPKHEILVSDIRVDPSAKPVGLRKGAAPFVVYSHKRKFYLAAQTKTDRDEWLELLMKTKSRKPRSRSATGGTAINSPIMSNSTAYKNNTHSRSATSESRLNDSQSMLIRSSSRQSSCRGSVGYRNANEEDDAKSVYSMCDSESGDPMDRLSVSSRCYANPLHQEVTKDDTQSCLTAEIDTLSFYSEPVLTPYELTVMGDPSVLVEQNTAPKSNKNQYKKRRAPMTLSPVVESPLILNETWNDKYQALISARVVTQEMALQRDVQILELIGNFRETVLQQSIGLIDNYHVRGTFGEGIVEESTECRMIVKLDNICYRFSCNYDEANDVDIEESTKRTSQEIRGVDAALQAACKIGYDGVPSMRTTLIATIDYKGFRVIANADVGDMNQVEPMHDLHPEHPLINETALLTMTDIGRELNLKIHGVQVNSDRRVQVPLSATAEVFLDKKANHMYLTNLHELFPVDYYVVDATQQENKIVDSRDNIAKVLKGETEASENQKTFSNLPGVIDLSQRLRPEFMASYQTPLSSDALTPTSGASRHEKEINDSDASRASRFLRETWIPAFVRTLDNFTARPFDSVSLTAEMHRNGINVRYLGVICSTSTVPAIRNMALIEMVARSVKYLFKARLRSAIIHFRSVGATHIEDQMKTYATHMVNFVLGISDKSTRFFEEKIKGEVDRKFNFQLQHRQFQTIHKPALFMALQYHCDLEFEEKLDYNFNCSAPLQKSDFKQFKARVKTLTGLPQISSSLRLGDTINIKNDERMAYLLARHFKILGPNTKLAPSNVSSTALTQVASFYNASNRFEEARLYAQAAATSASANHVVRALADGQLIFALGGIQSNLTGSPDPTLLATYRNAINIITWHWGNETPLSLFLHDQMSFVYHKSNDDTKALEFSRISLEIAEKTMGKSHPQTAAYYTKTACFLLKLGQIDEAIAKLTQALHIYQSLHSDPALIAEVHFHFAECLIKRGDIDGAIQHAQNCRRFRERLFGFSDIRVIESCRQVAAVILMPFKDYKGVLTPQIRQAYREAITCHEKVFRYLKTLGSSSSRGAIKQRGLIKRESTAANNSATSGTASVGKPQHILGTSGTNFPISGPLIVSPYGWSEPISKSLLHKLTKDIVSLKLALLESPRHRECVRTLRATFAQMAQEAEMRGEAVTLFDPDEAKGVIVRLAAVSPSVYLDGILQRINEGDESAEDELGVLLLLTERETVGLSTTRG